MPNCHTPAPMQQLRDERYAADLLSVSIRTLQAWRVRGSGPRFVKLGSAVRYRQSDLDAFIDSAVRSNTAA